MQTSFIVTATADFCFTWAGIRLQKKDKQWKKDYTVTELLGKFSRANSVHMYEWISTDFNQVSL